MGCCLKFQGDLSLEIVHKELVILKLPSRRFGRTGIDIPLLSLGGMRFQQDWKELEPNEITFKSQEEIELIISKAFDCGFQHLETARHYGTSELQLGWALKNIPNEDLILQTKVPPKENPEDFECELEKCFDRLQCKKLDLLAIHGLNLSEHLEQTLRPGGCLSVVRRWQEKGLIGHVGFSTHGSTDLIVRTIETNQFDYVNLHWYFIFQDNEPALNAAVRGDLGVFIISPTDKGGHLHTPSEKLLKLCAPLHPIVFNDLFCLRDQRVHTISVGAARCEDFLLHLKAVDLLHRTDKLFQIIEQRLIQEAFSILGKTWVSSWRDGLPNWQETPGEINIPVLLWLHNLLEAWEMDGFVRARYQLLGSGSHWFPGKNANGLDKEVSEKELKKVLINSPWGNQIPDILRKLKEKFGGKDQARLSNI